MLPDARVTRTPEVVLGISGQDVVLRHTKISPDLPENEHTPEPEN